MTESILDYTHRKQDFLHKQGQSDTYSCPQCQLYKQMTANMLECPEDNANNIHQTFLYNMLQQMAQINIPIQIL
jgi:hypothetical protein